MQKSGKKSETKTPRNISKDNPDRIEQRHQKSMGSFLNSERLLDLRGLSEYSSMGVPILRDYLRSVGLPHFKLKGNILVRISEFNKWLESFRVVGKQRLESIVDDVMKRLQMS